MRYTKVAIAIVILTMFFYTIGCLVPVAKAKTVDSWVNMEVISFDGENINFKLLFTALGNHMGDDVRIKIEPTSGSGEVTVEVWRAISQKIYSEDTNTTVFSYVYSYTIGSSFYEAGPKILNLLLFPADEHRLVFYLAPSFNVTVDEHPTVCQLPSQNYIGSFIVTPNGSNVLTVTVFIQHSEGFFWAVSTILATTLISLYGLSIYLIVLTALVYLRNKPHNPSNILTVSSAIIFFVPAFEIAFYSLKSPLPLVFSDMLMVFLIPLNAAAICFALFVSYRRKDNLQSSTSSVSRLSFE